eukprot:SAG31_NODE_2723_length_5187_cov_7.411164_2_plen_537_part_00
MPQIQCELATSSEWTSLTIQVRDLVRKRRAQPPFCFSLDWPRAQINWIVLGLMNPVVGILSDKFGRKNLIYASMAVFATGSIGCALSTSIAELMIARIVMGVGQAVSIITFAMVRDLIDDQDERMQLMVSCAGPFAPHCTALLATALAPRGEQSPFVHSDRICHCVQAFFNMMQPMMLLGAPTIGGFIVGFSSWRVLFWLLAGWGALLAVMVGLLIPETGSEAVPSTQASVAQSNPAADSSCCNKTHRLFDNGTYVVLTITAGLFMAGVRTMLATVTFIYSAYYCTTSQEVGILIALPTFAGFLSGNLAGRLSGKKAILKTPALLRYGMAGGLVAPASLVLFGMFLVQDGWWATTFPCAMMSATGFFCLPAMQVPTTPSMLQPAERLQPAGLDFFLRTERQVLILDPYKDMSGFAGGLSKMFMTFISAVFAFCVELTSCAQFVHTSFCTFAIREHPWLSLTSITLILEVPIVQAVELAWQSTVLTRTCQIQSISCLLWPACLVRWVQLSRVTLNFCIGEVQGFICSCVLTLARRRL